MITGILRHKHTDFSKTLTRFREGVTGHVELGVAGKKMIPEKIHLSVAGIGRS
jgi:hypothetical protein